MHLPASFWIFSQIFCVETFRTFWMYASTKVRFFGAYVCVPTFAFEFIGRRVYCWFQDCKLMSNWPVNGSTRYMESKFENKMFDSCRVAVKFTFYIQVESPKHLFQNCLTCEGCPESDKWKFLMPRKLPGCWNIIITWLLEYWNHRFQLQVHLVRFTVPAWLCNICFNWLLIVTV